MPKGSKTVRRRKNKELESEDTPPESKSLVNTDKMTLKSSSSSPSNKRFLFMSSTCLVLFLCSALWALTSHDSRRRLEDQMPQVTDGVVDHTPTTEGAITVGDHYVVLQVLPHDDQAFTQGLTYNNGTLWEGTGLNGQSELRRVDPDTGKVLQSHKLEGKYFGEGIAYFKDAEGNDRIIQITWKRKIGWIYDASTFEIIKEFTFATKTGEGWGITYNDDGKEFVVSDGSSFLFFWDRDTLEEKRRIEVIANVPAKTNPQEMKKEHMVHMNELEWFHGTVLANIWYQDVLIRIDPTTGYVLHVYNFMDLYKDRVATADCFNGISVTDTKDELWVTGKQWPNMYRIKLLQ